MANANNETLIEIVQTILAQMNDDEISSINDTSRSYDVAKLVEKVYKDYVLTENPSEHNAVIQLDPISDSAHPTNFIVPKDAVKIHSIRYNKRKKTDTRDRYQLIDYLSPEMFLYKILGRDSGASNADVVKLKGVISTFESPYVVVYNDRPPSYWTSFDDLHIICDSYDGEVDDTLQNSKTFAMAQMAPEFLLQDSFKMDVNPITQRYLISRATNLAFATYKGYVPSEQARAERKIKSRLLSEQSRFKQTPDWYAVGRL